MARNKINAVILPLKGVTHIHFCGGKLQTLGDKDTPLYIPIPDDAGNRFEQIEAVMYWHKVAHNITHIKTVRHCGESTDIEITYNEYKGAQ